MHKFSHRSDFGATQSADELPGTSALIFSTSLTGAIWDRYTLCGRRTLGASLRGIGLRTLPSARACHTTYGRRGCSLNPHFLRVLPSFRPSRPDSLGQHAEPMKGVSCVAGRLALVSRLNQCESEKCLVRRLYDEPTRQGSMRKSMGHCRKEPRQTV